MSKKFARNRILRLLLIACIGAIITACTSSIPGEQKQRSQHQEKELRDRIMTTQIDR